MLDSEMSKDSERALRVLNKHRQLIELQILTIEEELKSDQVDLEVCMVLINEVIGSVREFRNEEKINFDADYPQLFNSGIGLLKTVTNLRLKVEKIIKKPDSVNTSQCSNAQVKLPDIKLPSFSGDYQEWYSFRDTYNSLIGNNTALSNLEKFQYLKVSVKGEAARTIQSLETTGLNYSIALDILRDNFENKRMIVNSHIQSLFNLPYIKKESSQEYRDIINIILQNTSALKSLKRPIGSTEDWAINLIMSRFPHAIKLKWESILTNSEMPVLDDLIKFLTKHCQTLESVGSAMNVNNSKPNNSNSVNSFSCQVCSQQHQLFNCDKFLKMDTSKRLEVVRSKRLCRNCLKSGHSAIDCRSTKFCKVCNRPHNTLLHFTNSAQIQSKPSTSSSLHINNSGIEHVLLSTCVVEVHDGNSNQTLRALLDSGSQLNLITDKAIKKLNLKTHKTNTSFSGIGSSKCTTQNFVDVKIGSTVSNFNTTIPCFTINRITDQVPATRLISQHIEIPNGIQLADPQFYKPADIDLLIGVEWFYKLLVGKWFSKNELTFQNTQFGWVISGRMPYAQPTNKLGCHSVTFSQLNNNINRFWELENVENNLKGKTNEENQCETFFENTLEREVDGTFIVALPFKHDASLLGNSYGSAKRRLINLESKLQRNPRLKEQYNSFMKEYVELGHMKSISYSDENSGYFLPHHAVIKNSSLTTKLRVVFDASAKSHNKTSLNDLLMTGPTLQNDLFDILVRFRIHEYVITADIQMMYRQIRIRESDTKYQQILWRESPNQAIKIYQLQTVTYGTSCAPYLAVRCLQEMAKETDNEVTAQVIINDFYMDDVLTGAPTIEAARQLRDSLSKTLEKGGFSLRKWAANKLEIISDSNNSQINNHVLNLAPDEQIKTLGVQWNPLNDKIEYNSFNIDSVSVTKRSILSEISKYFDPLGLLGPVIIKAKIILQDVWKHQLNWDERVPENILESWLQLRSDLKSMQTIRTSRKAKSSPNAVVELHAFGDASMYAYGSAIYLKSIESDGTTYCELLCAKSRVAPLKSISLPRLELCAAVLTAKLVDRVKKSLRGESVDWFYYTDSTIVLSWLRSDAGKFKQFVSHRIGEIQRLSPNINKWQHIRSAENPADIISRGNLPSELIRNKMWWNGPDFLKQKWTPQSFIPKVDHKAELRSLLITETKPSISWLNTISSLIRLVRVTAWIQRFIHNAANVHNKTTGELNNEELINAENVIIRSIQATEFAKEIKLMKNSQPLDSHSKLLQLNPFLDQSGIIRVGGRLRYSKLIYDSKFPIVLPKNSFVTEIIIRHYHNKNFHIGPQGTLASVRTKYWPISGKNTVKRIVRKCVICFKANPRSSEPIMGNLPDCRAEQVRPFYKTGIDYGGPFMIREGKRKNTKLIKVYIALFVCMATKAVHIEVVSDLTTESFLAALRRFISRRGLVADLYSDNGTNFKGANNEIKKLYDFVKDEQNELKSALTLDQINWHFIPPRAPHFGGLWEAGIKSTKRLLCKIAGGANLTYEEFLTLLVQIEATLNSRPLCPLSDDPNDLSFLTPGHFLVGGNLRALPEPNLGDVNMGRLSRWQLVQRLQQQFWTRWQKEYLQELQGRRKWKRSTGQPLEVGQLVLIHEDNLPPSRWRVGRIVTTHPGSDGIVRTVTVKTRSDNLVRPTVKLCAFPQE